MKKFRTQEFVIGGVILFIILLASVFHYPIYFEDVLTLRQNSDFGVQIDFFRILFEPILGPLLYLNRTLYPLTEVPLTFLWILIFYVTTAIVKALRQSSDKKRKILNVLIDLPMLSGLSFTVFVVILFIPLPNNTIVNNSKDSILVTTHAHTEFSHDGLISQEKMWEYHKRNGFDAFFITDHAHHKKSLAFVQKQRNGDIPQKPLVMVGQEYSGSNHMSLLGLDGSFETKDMDDNSVIDSVHNNGGAVLINHWFDGKGKAKEFYASMGVDGFEIENVGKELYYNRALFKELKEFCIANNLMMVGGLDFHGYGRVCSLYNAFEIPNWQNLDACSKEKAILNILKNGPQNKLQILMYKDRPFYTESNLFLRPFFTLVNYFRTLNGLQVLSWILWLLALWVAVNRKNKIFINQSNTFSILSVISSAFLMILSIIYYYRGNAVEGYSKVYSEYSWLLGPIGVVLFIYAGAVWLFRTLRATKTELP
ncbi:PHP domain-containing protein [Kriegella aquimaris]|uniref:Predicted metal-dependent phosphoesterase TrpH, contains PHP domain n=1 Tax=Kriegella aquimaris TaxID=192904 RepID=A0A1G9J0U6_9FLAO|nr:PHP domain-containing protein [Kriegella aquimaris]SDL30896.1 Predicted metal-dependent phosphoesterase TrpH, contains PHP domain [Kriegella aquimaris]